jgi:hypothetical protein
LIDRQRFSSLRIPNPENPANLWLKNEFAIGGYKQPETNPRFKEGLEIA